MTNNTPPLTEQLDQKALEAAFDAYWDSSGGNSLAIPEAIRAYLAVIQKGQSQ